jgi:HSP20 family protein
MELDHLTEVRLSETRRNLSKLLSLHDRISTLGETLNADPDDVPLRLDLLDNGAAFYVVAELPGVSQDKLEVALTGRELTIAGMRDILSEDVLSQDTSLENDNKHATKIISERIHGHLQRTITLPSDVDRDSSTAQLREGLLVLYLPKLVVEHP